MRVLGLLCLLLLPVLAAASESAPFVTARDTVSLVSRVDSVAPGQTLRLGLRFRLAPGWHTYWSNPGDAGAPPTIEVTGAHAGPLAYPVPERLTEGPFTSFAYTGDLLLPFDSTAARAPASIDVHATWLVCAAVCVPEEARFHLDLPTGSGADGAQAPAFVAVDARLPRPSPWDAHLADGSVLWVAAPHLAVRDALFFPAEAGVLDQGAPQTLRARADRLELVLHPLHPGLRAIDGVLRLTDQGGQMQALSIHATPMALPGTGGGTAEVGLLQAILLALAGGLVLNLMPCVLPVFAMKALALARMSGASRAHGRREAALYTLGVVLAFGGIGGAMLAVRALGGAAGWGVQFQSAAFTTGMALLLLAIGLNFSGVFQVGARLAGVGQGVAARGSFFTGLLAVLVATPCTAPFMGAALAAALAMPAAAGLLVFVALGLGLAAPYAVLALTPGAARLLPRPGAWMDLLKQVLAFPMYGAALWMLWVTSQQVGAGGLAAAFAASLLIAFAAWAYGRAQSQERSGALGWVAASSVIAACALLVLLGKSASSASASTGIASDGSQPFSAARLSALLAAHRPVFVDMSAAWCVTCLVNERLALSPQDVRTAFSKRGVVYLKGDWTRQDAGISAYLHAHDRSGVPLYVYYAADGASQILPQILTPSLVLQTVGR